jgi:hypothetical protein
MRGLQEGQAIVMAKKSIIKHDMYIRTFYKIRHAKFLRARTRG